MIDATARAFPIRVVLSVTLGRLLCPVAELYDLIEYMTGERLRTYAEMIAVGADCRPHLLRQHPALARITATGDASQQGWEVFTHQLEESLGVALVVEPLPRVLDRLRTSHRSRKADVRHR